MRERPQKCDAPIPSPREICQHLDQYVIGQERAKRTVAIAAHSHLKRCKARQAGPTLLRKSNILMLGPTGSGKTHIARHLATFLEVPFAVVDATEYTEAGYYGKDVEVMIAELLFSANHSIEDTERGIVFVDEVDKLARRSHDARTGAGSRDIGGEGVQQGLLKLLEGREVFVPLNVTQHWNKHDFVKVNTADILFICAGTFSDLRPYGQPARAVGFGAETSTEAVSSKVERTTARQLQEYGMIAELLGRLPVVVELGELDEDDLFEIMTRPKDAVAKEYQELLALDQIDLHFTDGALREIAHFSTSRGAGARGLRAIMEEVCHEILFDAPDHAGKRFTLDARAVRRKLANADLDLQSV